MAKKYSDLSEAEKEVFRARSRAFSKRKSEAAALASGRAPGVVGRPRRYSDEERVIRRKQACRDYRHKDIDASRAHEAAYRREKRAARAVAEGREPGRTGQYNRPEPLPEDERRERHRAATLKHARANTGATRARYLENRELRIEASGRNKRRLRAEDPEKYREQRIAHANNRRARLGGHHGKFSAADVRWLWDRQKGCCAFCLNPLERKKYHVDHWQPVSRGGSNDRGNLRLLHPRCNLTKHARDPIEHAKEHGLLLW